MYRMVSSHPCYTCKGKTCQPPSSSCLPVVIVVEIILNKFLIFFWQLLQLKIENLRKSKLLAKQLQCKIDK